MKKFLPANRQKQHKKQHYPVSNRSSVNIPAKVPNLFSQKKYHGVNGNRLFCTYTERKAVYKDANGNVVVLSENESVINAPKDARGVEFRTPKKILHRR